MAQIVLPEGASPSTPATGNVSLYAKTDGKLYFKDDAGLETGPLGAGGGGSGITTLNSQTGTTQTFANDTNVTITSATNTHTLGWSGSLAISRGGTGQTTANAALNALLPSQTSNNGKVLTTDGTNTSWTTVGGTGTVTSVGLTMPTGFSVSGSPVTASGTLAVTTSLSGIVKAGTGAFSAATVGDVDSILPTQTGNSGKFLTTDGTNSSWATVSGGSSIQIFDVDASVAANALTVTINAQSIAFRSDTLTDGTPVTRTFSSPITMTVSSGSTLGTVNATAARLAVLAIDNGGTVEAAIVNLAGGTNLDETTLISTTAEGGAGAADSASVVYSTTARTNVAFRVVGFIDITEATAGTWASAPTKVQGVGGQNLAMSSLGFGQTWQNVAGSRVLGTTYYNTTGRTIQIAVCASVASNITPTINGVSQGVSIVTSGTVLIPPGASYSLSFSAGSILVWNELR